MNRCCRSRFFYLLLFFISCIFTSCSKENGSKSEYNEKTYYSAKVRQEFLHAWNAYKKYAWGHDALKPLSKSYHDWYAESFLMTPVDAFDTMKIMRLDKEADDAKALIFERLSFDKDIMVQNFEITIRLLGGLIADFQIDGDERFLRLAEDLGNRLLSAFDSPTGMPYVRVNLKTGETSGEINNPAEIGTLLIEFGTLSELTGNPVYYNKAKRALTELYKRRSKIGLVGTTINVETGEWIDKNSHLSGMIDSYYEYLLKSWLLFGDEECKEMWDSSITAINTYLSDETENGFWYGYVDMNTGKRTATKFGALDGFFPAVLVLSGDLDRAVKLQTSCYAMWNLYGIVPEQIDYMVQKATAEYYVLRPEIIESAYYLYHYTGDEKYRKMGETFLQSLIIYCRTDEGYAALKSVVTKEKEDSMESFFLAETLKYLYLLFAPAETLDFDKVIFNTEAHPIRKTWD
ncbi:MAG: glycoside hydrolase family 47 protein [Candidatus Latescibacteria bacterium]|nr:glycoside hydrolase family 47 protein [Candidatus Latescibacterota bacterium]